MDDADAVNHGVVEAEAEDEAAALETGDLSFENAPLSLMDRSCINLVKNICLPKIKRIYSLSFLFIPSKTLYIIAYNYIIV